MLGHFQALNHPRLHFRRGSTLKNPQRFVKFPFTVDIIAMLIIFNTANTDPLRKKTAISKKISIRNIMSLSLDNNRLIFYRIDSIILQMGSAATRFTVFIAISSP